MAWKRLVEVVEVALMRRTMYVMKKRRPWLVTCNKVLVILFTDNQSCMLQEKHYNIGVTEDISAEK